MTASEYDSKSQEQAPVSVGSAVKFWGGAHAPRLSLVVHEHTAPDELDALIDRAVAAWARLREGLTQRADGRDGR